MTWTWYTSAEGGSPDHDHDHGLPPSDPALVADLAEGWQTRGAAEAWLSDVYTDLVFDGVRQVTLLSDGTTVYSMSLDPGD